MPENKPQYGPRGPGRPRIADARTTITLSEEDKRTFRSYGYDCMAAGIRRAAAFLRGKGW